MHKLSYLVHWKTYKKVHRPIKKIQLLRSKMWSWDTPKIDLSMNLYYSNLDHSYCCIWMWSIQQKKSYKYLTRIVFIPDAHTWPYKKNMCRAIETFLPTCLRLLNCTRNECILACLDLPSSSLDFSPLRICCSLSHHSFL